MGESYQRRLVSVKERVVDTELVSEEKISNNRELLLEKQKEDM